MNVSHGNIARNSVETFENYKSVGKVCDKTES